MPTKPASPYNVGTMPYCMLGAGKLASTVWKTGDEASGWRYRFNVFRLSSSGRVSQSLRAEDLVALAKLTRVIASILIDDGCIAPQERAALRGLVAFLDLAFDES